MLLFAKIRQRINFDVVTRIVRQLPGPGKLLAKLGQEVRPSDIIAYAQILPGFRVIDLAKNLSCKPFEAKKYLKKPLGSTIYKGELLAFRKAGIFSPQKVLTSPTDGIIEEYDEKLGNLRLNFLPQQQQVASSLFGIVEKVDGLRGEVVIKTQVTQIYGISGVGKIREGILNILGGQGSLITKEKIPQTGAGQILVGGGLIYSGALAQAVSLGVKGIITGGINVNDFKSISGGSLVKSKFGTDVGITLMLTEGFGGVPIGEDIFQVFLKYNDKFALIDGQRSILFLPSQNSDSMMAIRNTHLPNIERVTVSLPKLEATEVALGQKVRICTNPFLGEQGTIISIDLKPTLLESGVSIQLLTIQTKRRKIQVPYTNVEVISH